MQHCSYLGCPLHLAFSVNFVSLWSCSKVSLHRSQCADHSEIWSIVENFEEFFFHEYEQHQILLGGKFKIWNLRLKKDTKKYFYLTIKGIRNVPATSLLNCTTIVLFLPNLYSTQSTQSTKYLHIQLDQQSTTCVLYNQALFCKKMPVKP